MGHTEPMDELTVFLVGGLLYVSSEIFWLEKSHWAMAFLGGFELLLLRRFMLRFFALHPALVCLISAAPLLAMRVILVYATEKTLHIYRTPIHAIYRGMLLAPAFSLLKCMQTWFKV